MRTATVSPQSVSQATVSQTVTPHSWEKSQKVAASQQTGIGPLRLTRRGRVVLTGLTALLVTVVMVVLGIGTGTAQATSTAPARGGADPNLVRVTVGPGENLWWVAEKADPGADPRDIIQEVVSLNRLADATVYPGEELWVPRE
jgi:hypothetical protein